MKIRLLSTLIGLAAMLGTAIANEPLPQLVFSPDGFYDIGSPANRAGNLYIAGSVFASGPSGASYATTATAAGTTTLTNASKAVQYFTGSTTQTVKLPVASTMVVGQSFTISNLSSGAVTVQSSGSNTVVVLAANTRATLRCVTASGTSAASWDPFYEATNAASGKVGLFSNSITIAGTDGITLTTPSTSFTAARTDAANTFTGHQTIEGVTSTGATGTGAFVFATSPTLVTPVIGAATGTSLALTNNLTTTAPNTQTGSTYTLLATDNYLIINASGTCTLTLGTATAGRVFTVKTIAAQTVVSASSNVVPQTTGTAGTAILAGTAGKYARLVGDGTNWVIMESN